MKCLLTGALAASVAGCAGTLYVPPPLPPAVVPTLASTSRPPPALTAGYIHRTPVEPEAPQGVAPADPGFSRPRLGS